VGHLDGKDKDLNGILTTANHRSRVLLLVNGIMFKWTVFRKGSSSK
jgi:hypothetical protein